MVIMGQLYLCMTCMIILPSSQGHETSALLILEKINDRNLINCTNAALQTYVVFPTVQSDTQLSSWVIY